MPETVKLPLMRDAWPLYSGPAKRTIRVTKMAPFVATKAMTRSHRPRHARIYVYENPKVRDRWHQTRLSVDLWCGQIARNPTLHSVPMDGLPLCGTCEGRAVGAGYPTTEELINGDADLTRYPLLFSPRQDFAPPGRCPNLDCDDVPGTGSYCCVVCGHLGRWAQGNGYCTANHMAHHKPADGMCPPCPNHAWNELKWHPRSRWLACKCGRLLAHVERPEIRRSADA